MNLIRWVAGSTARLAIASALGLALVFGGARPLTDYIRYESSSPVGDMLLLTALAFVILGTAASLGVLIGDAVFPGRWRERVILGQPVDVAVPDDSLEAVKSLRSYYLHYSVLVVGLIIAMIWGFNRMTDDFFSEFQRFGRIRSTLRSDDVEPKLAVLAELADWRRDDEVPGALEILDMVWRDNRQPDAVRARSLESLARLGVYLNDAVDQWRLENRRSSWQGDLLISLRREVAPALRAALADASPTLRPAIITALGALRDTRALDLLLAELDAHPDETSPEWRAAAIAIGRLRSSAALPRVAQIVTSKPDRVGEPATILAWVVREVTQGWYAAHAADDDAPSEADDAAFKALVEHYGAMAVDQDPARRCLAAVVLKYLRDQRTRPFLFAAFEAPGAGDVVCGADMFVAASDDKIYLSDGGEPLRSRLLDALAKVSVGDDVVVEWAKARLRDDATLSEHTRALLGDLISQTEAANARR